MNKRLHIIRLVLDILLALSNYIVCGVGVFRIFTQEFTNIGYGLVITGTILAFLCGLYCVLSATESIKWLRGGRKK